MKNIESKVRVEEINDDLPDFYMVDLVIDGEVIDGGVEPISNYSFWEDIMQEAQRAIYNIKKKNSKINFDFNFANMGVSKVDKENAFISHMKKKYPTLDIDGIISVFDNEITELKAYGPDDNHPNPEIRVPIDSDLVKNVLISVISKLNENKE